MNNERLPCYTVSTFVAHQTVMAWTEDPCQVFNAAAGDDVDPIGIDILSAEFQ